MDKPVWCGNNNIVLSHGTSDSRGVIFVFQETSNYNWINQYLDDSGRFIVLNSLTEDRPVFLINFYTPNEEKDQLKVLDDLNYIRDNVDVSEDTLLLWGGDFNLNLDIEADADGGSLKIKSKSKVSSMMSENYLCDIYIRLTWHRKTPFKQGRLNFF